MGAKPSVYSILFNLSGYTALFLSFFLIGCGENKVPGLTSVSYNNLYNFSGDDYRSYLSNSFLDTAANLTYQDTLKDYYESRNFNPVFVRSFDEEDLVYFIIGTLAKAEEHGLNPEVYHVSDIQKEYLQAIDTSFTGNRYIHLANTEKLIADGLVRYSYHLRYGVIKRRSCRCIMQINTKWIIKHKFNFTKSITHTCPLNYPVLNVT